jgi:NAD+ diphosphatase
MPDRDDTSGVYIFQGNDLVVPDSLALAPPRDGSEPDIYRALSRELLREPFWDQLPRDPSREPGTGTAYFETPIADGKETLGTYLLDHAVSLPSGWRTVPIRETLSSGARGILSGEGDIGRLFRAYHIMQWRRESAFCGGCGSPNVDAPDELARLCPACGRREYPRISPAIIVLITNEKDEALLAHNIKFMGGIYSLIAGFNEAGESLETTVAREVREEVGVEVEDIRYVASQPWPFPNSLMIGFTARYARGEIKPDGVEIEDARWFRREDLPKLPGAGSVSRYLINRWLGSR